MKICNVILTYDAPLYNTFDALKRRYFNKLNQDFLFVYNSKLPTFHDKANNTYNYCCNNPYNASGIPSMFNKFIDVIKSGVLDQYDFVVRSNSSTFVNMAVVPQCLKDKTSDIYMGYIDPTWQSYFVSGSCIIFSKDVLSKLSCHVNSVNSHREDDVVIGELMKKLNIPRTFLDRACFENYNSYNLNDTAIPSVEHVQNALTKPHIRIRNDSNREVIDTGIWKLIDQLT